MTVKSLIFVLLLLASAALAEEEDEERAASLSPEYILTTDYVHEWIAFPEIKGTRVGRAIDLDYKPVFGRATVLFFIASWDLNTQDLIDEFMALENSYSPLHTDFIYIFSHDTDADALHFMEEVGIKGDAILANHEVLKAFKQPPLPSIYVGDRNNWFTMRFLEVKPTELKRLDEFLRGINSY